MRGYMGILVFTTSLAAAPMGLSLAHGGGAAPSSNSGSSGIGAASPRNPQDAAKAAYNSGIRTIKKAQEADADALKAPAPEKAAKAQDKAGKYYQKALEAFIDAVAADPTMYQAWNYLGFANRHLGNYDASLSAYAKALELNPAYPEAIEYRGEAYLGLNKIEDAKNAYMSLFRDSRSLADELMVAMRRWTDARRKDSQGLSSEDVEAFAKWMEERGGVAAQTASLVIGAPFNWK